GSDALGSIDPLALDPGASIEIIHAEVIGAPAAIFPASDGCLWWVNSGPRTIARLDPRADDPASTAEEIAGPPLIDEARAWAAGSHGRVWLTVRGTDTLVRFDPDVPDPGSSATVVSSTLIASPDGVWHGDDGGIWFANTGTSSIGRLEPDATDPASA